MSRAFLALCIIAIAFFSFASAIKLTPNGGICEPADRKITECPKDYNPVCYRFKKYDCFKYPCENSHGSLAYSNACEACKNVRVASFSSGECNKPKLSSNK